MEIIDIFGFFGTISFAISGALSAMQKKMDVFGVFILGFVTALGGGTIRDVIIGSTPVFWIKDLSFMLCIVIGSVLALLFKDYILRLRKTLFLFDTIGLGIFTIAGVKIGLELEFSSLICITLGTITGCFGGVLRDVLSNQTPLIFHKEIYATVCIAGGAFYIGFLKLGLSPNYAFIITAFCIIVSRLVITQKQLYFPKWY
jgi:uncharacterized membrane protein YeiH